MSKIKLSNNVTDRVYNYAKKHKNVENQINYKKMKNTNKVIKLLELHNKWRRGHKCEMLNPIEIGWTIDRAIEIIKKYNRDTPILTKKLFKILDKENNNLKNEIQILHNDKEFYSKQWELVSKENTDLKNKLNNSLPNWGCHTIIDWEIEGCIEKLKGDWMSVALIGKDDLGNKYNACGETYISDPQVDNITDIQCEGITKKKAKNWKCKCGRLETNNFNVWMSHSNSCSY